MRDDRRREIVVAFRGSHELTDMVTGTHFVPLPIRLLRVLSCQGIPPLSVGSYVVVFADGNLVLIPLVSHGIENNTALVHAGFLISYNSVRAVVVHVVRDQLLAYPNYSVVISGSHPSSLLCLCAPNEWRRTLIRRRACFHRCRVCQVKYSIDSNSVVHLWCVIRASI